jgi:hypothetical protein
MLSAGRSPPSVSGNESSFFSYAAEPDIPSMRGKDQRAENGGVSTGIRDFFFARYAIADAEHYSL